MSIRVVGGLCTGILCGAVIATLSFAQPTDVPTNDDAKWCFYRQYDNLKDLRAHTTSDTRLVKLNGAKVETYILCKTTELKP